MRLKVGLAMAILDADAAFLDFAWSNSILSLLCDTGMFNFRRFHEPL